MDTEWNGSEGFIKSGDMSESHVSFHKNGNTEPFSGIAYPMQND